MSASISKALLSFRLSLILQHGSAEQRLTAHNTHTVCTIPTSVVDPAGSGSTWIRIHFAVMDPYPDPYWECGSGSGSSSMETDQNLQLNLVFCLSKRLLFLHPMKPMRIHNTDPNYFQITQPGSTVIYRHASVPMEAAEFYPARHGLRDTLTS
jgi:hypothetical protein